MPKLERRQETDLRFLERYDVDPRFRAAAVEGLRLMERLDPEIYQYHNKHHAIDVIKDAMFIGLLEGISKKDLGLLLAGAAFHDTGFTEVYDRNEPVGARLARESLKRLGIQERDVVVVENMIIKGTTWPQRPETKLERILADADVANFGKRGPRGFVALREAVRCERTHQMGVQMTNKEWQIGTYNFLAQHHYFTESARSLFGKLATAHIAELKVTAESIMRG
jgi:hypothetical protein